MDKFLSGELSETENEKYTARLLQEKFDRETRQQWGRILAEEHKLSRTGPTRRQQRPLYKYLAVAASLAFLLVIGQLFYQSSTSSPLEMADSYLERYKMEEFGGVLRAGAADDVPQLRKDANTAYANDKYQEAIQYAEKIVITNKAEPQDFLMLGLSHLYLDDATQAIEVLKKGQINSKVAKTYESEINWFLSIAYIKAQQPEMAKPILKDIVSRQQWNHSLALEILESF